jgi:hypothetical protein
MVSFAALVGAGAAVIQEQKQSVVAISERCKTIRLGQEGVHLGFFEIPDHGLGCLLERGRSYFAAPSHACW